MGAIAGGAAAAAKLAEARDALLERTATPAQRTMLARSLDQHLALAGEDIQRHTDQQKFAWQRRVAQDRLDLLRKQVALDHSDPGLLEGYARAGETAALDQARITGLLPESDEAKQMAAGARSSLYRSAIEGALAAGNHEAASTLYERAKDKLAAGDTVVVQPQLKAAAEIETAREYVGKIILPPNELAACFDAPRLMEDADAEHEAATEQNNSDWTDNPTQRATNQHYIDVQFGQKKRWIQDSKRQLERAVANWLIQPMSDGQPQISRPPLALWIQLSVDEQKAVDRQLAQNARGPSAASEIAPIAQNALAECRGTCLDKYISGLLPGARGSDAPLVLRRCVRDCLRGRGIYDF